MSTAKFKKGRKNHWRISLRKTGCSSFLRGRRCNDADRLATDRRKKRFPHFSLKSPFMKINMIHLRRYGQKVFHLFFCFSLSIRPPRDYTQIQLGLIEASCVLCYLVRDVVVVAFLPFVILVLRFYRHQIRMGTHTPILWPDCRRRSGEKVITDTCHEGNNGHRSTGKPKWCIQFDWLTAKRDGVEESMLFRGAKPLALAGLAVCKTGVTGALPRRSPQAFSYEVSIYRKKK